MTAPSKGTAAEAANAGALDSTSVFNLEMYILTCKGSVYQSCGDDEQSLLHYMEGWAKAKSEAMANANDKTKVVVANGTSSEEWEMVAVNAIGMLAYHNVRYEVAALCFNVVAEFRKKVCLVAKLCCSLCEYSFNNPMLNP